MSHFTTLSTRITETESLVSALADLGCGNVEVHGRPQHLYGFEGDQRRQMAEVIIRREHIGTASNDIGFARRENGTFDAIISDYDRARYSPQWLDRLTQRYAYHVANRRLREQQFELVTEEVEQSGRIHLVLRRMT